MQTSAAAAPSVPKFMLVKLPDYVYENWSKHQAEGNGSEPRVLGYVEVAADGSSKLVLSESEEGAPSEMPFKMKPATQFPMLVFSESAMGEEDNPAAAESTEVYALQGSVGATADALPRLTPEYLRFKRARDEQRTAERAARSVGFSADYTPLKINMTELAQSQSRARKEAQQQDKRSRAEAHQVLAILRRLYALKSHYSMKELLEFTQQPKQHLQSILNVYCQFHDRGENVNTYSLRDADTVTL